LEFEDVSRAQYSQTWNSTIPLKIKIFLWLIQQNKILTKDNHLKRKWQGDPKCIFCGNLEIVNHLFLHYPTAICLWFWICNYKNYSFTCILISDLWYIDASFSYKNDNICKLIRGIFYGLFEKKRIGFFFKG
jgi:zinc-binding in reverse transcriptase